MKLRALDRAGRGARDPRRIRLEGPTDSHNFDSFQARVRGASVQPGSNFSLIAMSGNTLWYAAIMLVLGMVIVAG